MRFTTNRETMAPRFHLIDVESQHRETEAIRYLVRSPFLAEHLMVPLGIAPPYWLIVQAQFRRLGNFGQGDVDILAGPLRWSEPAQFDTEVETLRQQYREFPDADIHDLAMRQVAADGGIEWPPTQLGVVGIEAKCSYFRDGIRSAKSSRQKTDKIRSQINRLLALGLDSVALLDIIANPPSEIKGSAAWLAAANRSADSVAEMMEILQERLPPDTRAGHAVWSAGSVTGGDESQRGAGVPEWIRMPTPPAGPGNSERTNDARDRLGDVLQDLPRPRYMVACFIDCQVCGCIHPLTDMPCVPPAD